MTSGREKLLFGCKLFPEQMYNPEGITIVFVTAFLESEPDHPSKT